jgi:tetratricopeptide (TPR) repeat protein
MPSHPLTGDPLVCYAALKMKGEKALEKKHYDNALAFFEAALLQTSDNPEAFKNIGNVYLKQEALEQAEIIYRKALSINPEYWLAKHNLAIIFYKKKRYELAEKHFLEVTQVAPNYFKTYINMGRLYHELGEDTKAEANFCKALELAPDDLLVVGELANYWMIKKNHQRSINLLNQQFSKFPEQEHYLIHLFLAERYFKLERYRKSLEHLQTSTKLNPHYSEAFHRLASVYEQKGNYKKALDAYMKALSLDIKNGTYLTKINRIYQNQLSNPNEAKAIFKHIEKGYHALLLKNPLADYIYGELANYYKEQGRFKKCKIFAKKAMAISPDPFYNWLIAACCYYEGNSGEAVQNLQKMIKLDPKNRLGWMQKSCEGLIFIYSDNKNHDLAAHYQAKLKALLSYK